MMYKQSGVEWLGEIPSGWSTWKVSRLFKKIGSGTTPTAGTPEYYADGIIPWINTGDLNDSYISVCSSYITQKAFDDHSSLKTYEAGTLIIAMYGATIGKIAITKFEACTNQACCSLVHPKLIDTKFAFYWFIANKENIINLSYGGGQPNISQDIVRSLKIPICDIPEQQSIVHFLDYKTGQIDSFIANRQKQIELLKEQKAGIINKAVTKGINPDAKMKPSGIEWIGEIPEGWEVVKLKYAAKLQSGETITADDITEIGDYPVFGGNGLRGYADSYTNEGNFILIGRQGALCGNINYATGKFWASEHAVVAYLRKPINILWFGELLRAMNLNQYSQAAAQPGLSVDRIKNLFLPFPNYQEQNVIELYIKSETTTINTLISKYQKQIDLMQEYRTSLISQAVTGKIDVREWQPNKKEKIL
ncbi:MAG: restriction endonuclease subunit S [bacterium]